MKTLFTPSKISALLVVVVVSMNLLAQGGDNSKVIKKDYSVNPDTRLEIYNKYGNVDVVNREDANLTIQVVIKVEGRDRENADRLLELITIDITQEGDVIKAVTEIDEDINRAFMGNHSDNNGLQINYTITMPKTVPLNLSNKYGNVFINELTSTSIIDVKYGKLTANKILHDSKEPLTKVYLSYSNGTIQETKWIELDIKYSKINITESKALAVLSKYSKVYVTNGSSIVSESKYDTYEIGRLNNFVTTAGYGHFNIGELTGKLQVDSKYSDVIVDKISEGFESIKMTNSYGTYKLGIPPGASYRISGYAKYCSITYPENNSRVNRFNENNEMKVEGIIGSNPSPKAEVSISSHYGNVRLIQ